MRQKGRERESKGNREKESERVKRDIYNNRTACIPNISHFQ